MAAPPPGRRHRGMPRVADGPKVHHRKAAAGVPATRRRKPRVVPRDPRAGPRQAEDPRMAEEAPPRNHAPEKPQDGPPQARDPQPPRARRPQAPQARGREERENGPRWAGVREPAGGRAARPPAQGPATPARVGATTGGSRRPLRCRREPSAGGRSHEPARARRRRPGPTPAPDPRRRGRAPRTSPGPDRVRPEASRQPRRAPEATPRRRAARGPAQEVRRVPDHLVRDALAGAWGRSFGPRMLPRAAPDGRPAQPIEAAGLPRPGLSTTWEAPIPPTGSGG
jgi:hypothetical protein